jgi:non-canonical purine NTP pyrophosphatase (RdgB/HAM1 family)
MPVAEQGVAWNPDSPKDNPRIVQLLNPEGQQTLAAKVMAMVVARRAEARVSDDQGYALPSAHSLLVSGEPAKAIEINYALAHKQDILRMPSRVDIPAAYTDELREGLIIKARHARQKFNDSLLTVESTGLLLPQLYADGVPAEFVEWLSKKDISRLLALLDGKSVPAAAVTLMAQINESGEVKVSQGVVSGTVLAQGRGQQGMGWDSNFIADGMDATYAEMGEGKYLASSRAIAANELL